MIYMDEEQIPKRSSFWFAPKESEIVDSKLFDRPTVIFSFVLALFTFIIYWPLVSSITLEEAFYTPLVPTIIWFFSIFGISASEILRILFILSLVLSTSTIYLLVREQVRRQVVAILASIIYLIPPIPVFVLTFFRRGLYEAELASAKSFLTIIYGDGAHFLALALIPLALLFFLRFLKSGSKTSFVLVVALLVLVLLSNSSQSLFLFLILLIATLTDMFLGKAREKLKKMLMVMLFTVGLVSFWYTPSFWLIGVAELGASVVSNFKYFFPLPAAVLVFSLAFAYVFFAKKRERQPIFMAFAIFIVFFAVSIDWFTNGRSFLPYPQRLLPDILMFGSIVCALSLSLVFDLTKISKLRFGSWSTRTLAAFGFALFSFVLLSAFAYIVSPLAILLVSGERGIWARVRLDVLAERQEKLDLAGGIYKLVPLSVPTFDIVLGVIVSVVVLACLTIVVAKSKFNE